MDPPSPVAPPIDMHGRYDDRRSSFARRLAIVQRAVCSTLESLPAGPIVVIDICAGEGRTLIPAIANHPRAADVQGLLIEVDERASQVAEASRERAGLDGLRIVRADAGLSSTYAGAPRANIVILSGVLHHLSAADRLRTIAFLEEIAAPGATLIWTIGVKWNPLRPWRVRRMILSRGFDLVQHRRARAGIGGLLRWHDVGIATLTASPQPLVAGRRIFTFRPPPRERWPRTYRWLSPAVRIASRLFTTSKAVTPRASRR